MRSPVDGADEHRQWVGIEQQAERGLALLHFGDVDAQADGATVAGAALLDQNHAPVGQHLLVRRLRVAHEIQPLADPLFLAALGGRIVAARHADAQRVLKLDADFEKVGAALVDIGILLVPEDVASLVIEEDDPLRQDVDSLAQTAFRRLRVAHRSLA